MTEELEDFGWANGWPGTKMPDKVRKCKEAGHRPVEVDLGSCVHQVTCAECSYTYKYDSGD